MKKLSALSAGGAAFFLAGAASATTYDVQPGDDLFGILGGLVAGDEVVIHAGTYITPGFFEVTWAGTAAQPIVVRGADGELPVIEGDPSQNVINLAGSYFTLKNLEIVGGSHGVRLASADHATLEDLVIHGLGDVGISCNRPGETCDAMTLRHNEIYDTGLTDTGEGMYLGCNDAACTFKSSVVERNFIHDLGGSQGDGIEIKTGSYANVVRDNVIVRANYPGITMYGFAGGGAPNLVERNLVWKTNDNGIQVVGQVVVRNNIVLEAGANGIHSKASQAFLPDGAIIVNNTVFGAGAACLKSNDWAASAGQIVANNALYCPGGTAVDLNGGAPGASVGANVALGSSNAPGGVTMGVSVAADLGDPASAAVYPPAGSALIGVADEAHAPADDFNGLARADGAPDVGAYERSTGANPGWAPTEDFKDAPPGGSGGAGGGAGGGPGAGGAGTGAGGGLGGSGGGGAGSTGAGASAASPDASDDGGCGCRTAPSGYGGGAVAALVALVACLGRRRRRRA